MSRRPLLVRDAGRARTSFRAQASARPKCGWRLDEDLKKIREEFPILGRSVYLISNSLGAVPRAARSEIQKFLDLWEREGVSAWETAWWDLGVEVGDLASGVIGAPRGAVTMMTNATQAHWTALSTRFLPRTRGAKRRVLLSDQDFPSVIYAVREICRVMGWEPVVVSSRGAAFDPGPVLEAIDERTLIVAVSHVHFKSAFIQDIGSICLRAKKFGAMTLIDGYHAPGVLPVDVVGLGADFYVGGCLKWLCGGPGTAFLYVRPGLARRARPALTGWAAHRKPFLFGLEMSWAGNNRRFQSGTPPIPCLYTARAGLEAILRVGLRPIRKKSLRLTERIILRAEERGFPLLTPRREECRAGHVSFHVPDAGSVNRALEARGVKTDHREGGRGEPDMLRVGPHFYNSEEEVDALFEELDDILRRGRRK